MNWKAAAAFAFLVLLSGCTASGSGGAQNMTAAWGWTYLAAAAMAIMCLVLALGYMAGSFLNDDHLKAWVKGEVGQLGYSAVILAVAVFLVAGMDSWTKTLALSAPVGGTASTQWQSYVNNVVCCDPAAASCIRPASAGAQLPCHLALATDYLQILFESTRQEANQHVLAFGYLNFLGGVSVGAGAAIVSIIDLASLSIRPLAALTLFAEYHTLMFDLAFKTMMFIRAQQIFLEYLWAAIFPVMMALGLVLRTLHFSRKLGGLLLALALSFYIVMPMFYALMDAILFGFVGGWVSPHASPVMGTKFSPDVLALPGAGAGFVPVPAQPATAQGGDPFASPVNVMDVCGTSTAQQKAGQTSMVDDVISLWSKETFRDWKHAGFGLLDFYFEPGGPTSALASLMIFSMIAPFMGLMATLAAFKHFSPLLGGDVEISLISRLI